MAQKKITDTITKVIAKIGTAGIWAIDRGGDCNEIIEHLTTHKLKFVTRLKLNRWLLTKNKNGGIVPVQADRLETHASLPYKAQINKIDDRKETVINITFGTQKCDLYQWHLYFSPKKTRKAAMEQRRKAYNPKMSI